MGYRQFFEWNCIIFFIYTHTHICTHVYTHAIVEPALDCYLDSA